MIFRQMFDSTSGTYSYLLASRRGGEALIIDGLWRPEGAQMRKHSKLILLAEEQLVFGHSLPQRQSQERHAGKSFARIVRCKDRAQKSGTPLACEPVGRVS
jgi:hypothetical protein